MKDDTTTKEDTPTNMAGNRLLSTSIAVVQPVADAHVSKTRQRYTRAGTQIDGQTECARTRVACLALGKTHAGVRAAVVQNEHCEQDAAARDPNVCERDDHKRNRLGRGKAQGVGKHQLEGAPGSSTEATAFDRCTGSNQRGISGCDFHCCDDAGRGWKCHTDIDVCGVRDVASTFLKAV